MAETGHCFNSTAQLPDRICISAAPGGSNVSLVTIQLNVNSGALAKPAVLILWLSDSATGIGLTGTTASGAVAAGSSGADLGDLTSKKCKVVQTDATGKYVLSITDTGKTAFVPAVALPGVPATFFGDALTAANYG
jgi:hypothetical protein